MEHFHSTASLWMHLESFYCGNLSVSTKVTEITLSKLHCAVPVNMSFGFNFIPCPETIDQGFDNESPGLHAFDNPTPLPPSFSTPSYLILNNARQVKQCPPPTTTICHTSTAEYPITFFPRLTASYFLSFPPTATALLPRMCLSFVAD